MYEVRASHIAIAMRQVKQKYFLICHLVEMDYSLQHPEVESCTVSFLPGETTNECQIILILEDTVLEETEIFTMSLTTNSPVADLSPAMATVNILDNDGGLHSSFV